MTTITPDWDIILQAAPSTSTHIGGKWAVLLSSLLNGLDIELIDASKVPLIGTSFYFKSNRLRIQDEEGSHFIKFVLDNIDEGNNKTLRIRRFIEGDSDYLVTESEPATLVRKTINATSNAISNIRNGSIANDAGIGWGKIDTTGSKLQDMKNVNTAALLDGQVLQYNVSMDSWLPLTPPSNSSNTGIVGGSVLHSGDGSTTVFTIPHGMSTTPTTISVEPASAAANANPFTRTVDATNITITYTVAPASGTNNLAYFWMASDASSTNGSMVYTNQANTFGAFNQTIPSGNLRISNGGFFGSLQSTLTASRIWTMPDGAGTVLLDTLAQIITEKTINVDANTIKHSTDNNTGRLLKSNGTKFDSFNIGAASTFLAVNAAGNDLEWVAGQKAVTIANMGLSGEGILKEITADGEIQAYKIDSGSDKISIIKNTQDNIIHIDVDPAELIISSLSGTLPYSKLALAANVKDTDIATHTSSKITIVNKSQLNDQIVYKDAGINFGDVEYKFTDDKLFIFNPDNSYYYQFIASAITANRTITLPLLTSNDVFTFNSQEQILSNKTLVTPKIATVLNGTGIFTFPETGEGEVALTNDPRFLNIGPQGAHAANHYEDGGQDVLQIDLIGSGTDITTNNASILKHGLFMKLSTTPFQVPRINAAGDGMEWASLNSEKVAMSTASGNGAATIFNVPHGQTGTPTYAFIQCSSHSIPYTWTKDATNIIVTFTSAPATGTDNVIFYWNVIQ